MDPSTQISRGNVAVGVAPVVADINNPTLAELGTGIGLDCSIQTFNGTSSTDSTSIDWLCDPASEQLPGSTTHSIDDLVIKGTGQADDDLISGLNVGDTVYIWRRDGLAHDEALAASQMVWVWKVIITSIDPLEANNTFIGITAHITVMRPLGSGGGRGSRGLTGPHQVKETEEMFNSYEELKAAVEQRREEVLTLEIDLGGAYSAEYEQAKQELAQAKAMKALAGGGFLGDNISELEARVAETKPESNSVWVQYRKLDLVEWAALVKQQGLGAIEQYEKVLPKTFIGVWGQDPVRPDDAPLDWEQPKPLSTNGALLSSRGNEEFCRVGHCIRSCRTSWPGRTRGAMSASALRNRASPSASARHGSGVRATPGSPP